MVKIYLLPGRGGQLETGLGAELMARGFQVRGRELRGEFARLAFSEQIETVATDLYEYCLIEQSVLIANSFGAYLFLHAQRLLRPFAGRIVFLSPIVGEACDETTRMVFVPPRDGQIQNMLQDGTYPRPANGEIHVGSLDWQSSPKNVARIGEQLQWPVHIVEGAGHRLPSSYVGAILSNLATNRRTA